MSWVQSARAEMSNLFDTERLRATTWSTIGHRWDWWVSVRDSPITTHAGHTNENPANHL
jgi:hypothetical protein